MDPIVYVSADWHRDVNTLLAQVVRLDAPRAEPVVLFGEAWGLDVSPDGQRVLFSTHRDGYQLFVMDSNGANVQQVTAGGPPGNKLWPRWAPDNTMAYVFPGSTADAAVWVLDGPGRPPRRVTEASAEGYADGGLDFFAGGRMIVFSQYEPGTRERHLHTVPSAGGSVRALPAESSVSAIAPVVSHNGALLAYRAFYASIPPEPFHESIRVVAVGTWRLVHEITLPEVIFGNISGVDFSADDRRVVFSAQARDVGGSLQNHAMEIFSIGVDGTDLQRLTRNLTEDSSPVTLAPSATGVTLGL